MGCVGKDANGTKLEECCAKDGVNAVYRKDEEAPTGTCGSREIQVDAQAIFLLSRHLFHRHLARRVSHHVSSGAGAAPDVLVAYIRSAGPIVGAPHKDGKPSEKECSENGCKRASKSGCCGFRRSSGGEGGGDGFKLLELLTQDEDSREKKADAGITHSAAPTHGVCGSVPAVIGAAGPGSRDTLGLRCEPRLQCIYEDDDRGVRACAAGLSLHLVGKSCAAVAKVLHIRRPSSTRSAIAFCA